MIFTSLIVLVELHDLLSTAKMAFSDVKWQAQALEAYVFVGIVFFVLNGVIAMAGNTKIDVKSIMLFLFIRKQHESHKKLRARDRVRAWSLWHGSILPYARLSQPLSKFFQFEHGRLKGRFSFVICRLQNSCVQCPIKGTSR